MPTAAGKHEETLDPTVTAQSVTNPRVRTTCGEILPDGTVVDLVARADQERLDLLYWDGKGKPLISPATNRGSIIYYPPDLHPSVREAVTFPHGVVDYSSTAALFKKIALLLCEHARLPEDLAAFTTCWILSTWIPECMLIPFMLCVSSTLMHATCNLFRLFSSLCRRALLVAELSRRLPFFLSPTMMVNDPSL